MAFWHPFADMAAVAQQEFVIERGEGPWVFDTDDKRYLDATASLWYANIGHGRAEVADAVAAQMRKLEAYHTFTDVGNRPGERAVREARRARADAGRARSSSRAAAATRSRSRPSSPAATSSCTASPSACT